MTPKNHVLYSNRSGAYASLGNGADALHDADRCLDIAPQWAKGYGRKGAAFIVLGKYKEAIKAYKAGLEIEPLKPSGSRPQVSQWLIKAEVASTAESELREGHSQEKKQVRTEQAS